MNSQRENQNGDMVECGACGATVPVDDSHTDSDGFTACRPSFPISNEPEDLNRFLTGPCYRESLAREPATADVCSCAEVAGENPKCVRHGEGTLWAKENPDVCEIAERLALSRAAPSNEPAIAEGERVGSWEDNVSFLLANCPHTIRAHEGGGPENLIASLVLTFGRMQQELRSATTPPTTNDAIPAGRYLADRFKWAAPGDQQEDVWLVRFCDNDVRDAIYAGPEAESEAWAAWNRHAPGYNMFVFRLAALSAAPSAPATEEGEEAENKPRAWMRRWAFDRNEGTAGNRPKGWTLLAVTDLKLLPDDVPLYADIPARASDAFIDVAAERAAQIDREGYSLSHDDGHRDGLIALAAACYAASGAGRKIEQSPWWDIWPWDMAYWKPQGSRRDLVRAGALIVAEIERLDRALSTTPTDQVKDAGKGGEA